MSRLWGPLVALVCLACGEPTARVPERLWLSEGQVARSRCCASAMSVGDQDAGRRLRARERNRRWRERHPDAWRAYQRAKVRRWRSRHHDVARAIERRSDAKRRAS